MTTVVRDHWHQAGLMRRGDDRKVRPVELLPMSIQHLHPFRDDRPHVHQVCIHEPAHLEFLCPSPVSSREMQEPPLCWNSDEDPETTQREGIRNLGRRRQRELGIEGQA